MSSTQTPPFTISEIGSTITIGSLTIYAEGRKVATGHTVNLEYTVDCPTTCADPYIVEQKPFIASPYLIDKDIAITTHTFQLNDLTDNTGTNNCCGRDP